MGVRVGVRVPGAASLRSGGGPAVVAAAAAAAWSASS